jgi:hypothetical protein
MNWKIGQKLVCIHEGDWFVGVGPKKDEIVTVLGFGVGAFTGRELVFFEEYSDENGYMPEFFRPLLGESAKSELVSSFKEVTETSDAPMIPETETA